MGTALSTTPLLIISEVSRMDLVPKPVLACLEHFNDAQPKVYLGRIG